MLKLDGAVDMPRPPPKRSVLWQWQAIVSVDYEATAKAVAVPEWGKRGWQREDSEGGRGGGGGGGGRGGGDSSYKSPSGPSQRAQRRVS